MPVPSKEAQEAEAKARAESGVSPADNAAALDTIIDGPREDPGGDPAPRQAGEPVEQRTTPPVRSKFQSKRDEIISRFRTDRDTRNDEERDDISDFARSGMPPEFEPPRPVEAQHEAQPDPETPPKTPPAAPPKHKLKVRGQDLELSLDEVIAHAQKALAGEDYLEESKRKLKEVDDLLRTTKEQATRPGPSGVHPVAPIGAPPTDPQPTKTTEGDGAPHHPGDDDIAKLLEVMQFGDPEEARALFQTTIETRASKAAADAVAKSLQAQRLQDEGARATKVLNDFAVQHPEIATDKKARAAIESDLLDYQVEDILALGIDLKQIRQDGLDPTPADIALAHRWYRAEGFKVRSPSEMLEAAKKSYLDWKGVKVEPNPADPGEKAAPRVEVTVDRTARRAAIPQQPGQSGAPQRTQPPQPAPQPRDRSEIVQQMKLRTKGYARTGGAAVPAAR